MLLSVNIVLQKKRINCDFFSKQSFKDERFASRLEIKQKKRISMMRLTKQTTTKKVSVHVKHFKAFA